MSPEFGSEVNPLPLTVLIPRTFSRLTWNKHTDTHTKLDSQICQFNIQTEVHIYINNHHQIKLSDVFLKVTSCDR